MSFADEIKLYLPRYLSEDSTKELLKELEVFPTDGTKQTIYTTALKGENTLFQGDGVKNIRVINLPSSEIGKAPVMILSNTCDIALDNKRDYAIPRICYAPILNLEKYRVTLQKKKIAEVRINSHIEKIKRQQITSILYLPQGGNLQYEGIVFLDRLNNISNEDIDRDDLQNSRLFTLSNYGLYLFLLKLSIHFSRIQEKIDRNKGVIIQA